MSTIIVDTSQYKSATGRVPPKRGKFKALFMLGETSCTVVAPTSNEWTFAQAINEAKATARQLGVNTITLQGIQFLR